MEVVADSSAILAAALDEPERDAIIEATQDCTLLAPVVLPFEIGNALVAMHRRGRLEASALHPVWEATQRIPIQLIPIDVERALALAVDNEIYAYDAYYLQCAIRRQRPMITLDRKMKRVANILGVRLLLEP